MVDPSEHDEPDPYFKPEGCLDSIIGCLGTIVLLAALAAVWFGTLWFATGR